MRKLTLSLLASSALALAAHSASAADMARPVYKAPPPAVVAAYNWSGFYAGGHLGYGWGGGDIGDSTGALVTQNADGFLGGVQVGYNWQVDRWVFGIEGDWSWSNGKADGVAYGIPFETRNNWYAMATGRLGYAWDTTLWYVKGGAAWVDSELNVPGFGSTSGNRTGWTIGTGFEWAFAPQWSTKIEYNYLDFGNKTYANTLGVYNVDSHAHLLKVGLNYHFGMGKAPVVANY